MPSPIEDLGASLYWEARHGRVEGVRLLVAEGAPVDWAFPEDGRTALCAAASFDHLAAVSALIEAGADVDAQERESGQTPLTMAVIEGSARSVERLISAGADVNALDADGLSPLMHAALAGSKTVTAALLKAGAVLGPGASGVSAADVAIVQGNAAVAKLIEDDAAVRRAACEKEAAEKAAAERAAADRAVVEQRAAEEKAAKERAAVEKAAAEEKAAKERAKEQAARAAAAAEKVASDDATAEHSTLAASAATTVTAPVSVRDDGEQQPLQPPAKVARTRMAAPTPGQFAPTRLEVNQDGEDVVVKLHATEIVRLRPTGDLTLSSGGWRTVSTLEALNTSITELVQKVRLEVFNADDEWSLRDEQGVVIPFVDGMTIPTRAENPLRVARLAAVAAPSEATANTHGACNGNCSAGSCSSGTPAAASGAASCGGSAPAATGPISNMGAVTMGMGGSMAMGMGGIGQTPLSMMGGVMGGGMGATGMAGAATPQQRMLMQMMQSVGGPRTGMPGHMGGMGMNMGTVRLQRACACSHVDASSAVAGRCDRPLKVHRVLASRAFRCQDRWAVPWDHGPWVAWQCRAE